MNNHQVLVTLRENSTNLRALYGLLKNNELVFSECMKKHFPTMRADKVGVALLGRVAQAARTYSDNENADDWVAVVFDLAGRQLARELAQRRSPRLELKQVRGKL